MKVVCTKENLLRGLAVVNRSVGKDVNLPVLANILVEAKQGVLKLSATNLEIGTTCLVRGRIEKEGAITLPAALFYNYIASLPNTNIELFLDKETLKVKCADFVSEINGIKASEFPLIPKLESQAFLNVKAEILKEALEKIIFAAAKDELRPEISGIFLKANSNLLRLAATDSYRLGEVAVELDKSVLKEVSLIVPVATMQELIRILDEQLGFISFFTIENQIKFKINDVQLVSRLVEGQYPDYLRIIPKKFTTELEVGKEQIIKAIKTTSLFAKKDTNELKMQAKANEKEIEFSAEADKLGKNLSKVKCGFLGEDVSVIFNYKYLIDGLNSIPSDIIKIKLLGDKGPGMLIGKNEKNHFYVVMPIKR